jgi:hypothetical protein
VSSVLGDHFDDCGGSDLDGGVTVLAAKAFGGKRDSKEANGQGGGGDESEETRPKEKENEA